MMMNNSSMEKRQSGNNKSKNKLLRLLPKAAQVAVSFQNHPFSPGREKRVDVNSHKFKTHLSKGFSGPIFSMIPAEAREKSKNFETQEPTSPKISCMGQIKHKNDLCKKKIVSNLPKEFKPAPFSGPEKVTKARSVGPERISKARSVGPASELKKKPSGIKQIFGVGRKSTDHSKPPLPERAPSLSQMRRFASSRDTLAGFDWTTAQIAPENHRRDLYSDEDSDGEDDILIPFSAPILVSRAEAGVVGGLVLEPRKEINLWKRRTMSQPKPLQLNIVRAQ